MGNDERAVLLADVPANRLADLALRKVAGRLTAAEYLALCVLAGGRLGDETADKLIDAALTEYGTGGYRVPVRVVGDPDRLKLIFSGDHLLSREDADVLSRMLRARGTGVALLPPGVSVQVLEVEPRDE